MTQQPQVLIEIGKTIGQKIPFWIQGAGGNVSIKQNKKLWIKASGTRLEDIGKDKTLACLDFEKAKTQMLDLASKSKSILTGTKEDTLLELEYAEALKNLGEHSSNLGRPSMETGFHVLLPNSWVLHFHALSALLMSQESQSQKFKGLVAKHNLKLSTTKCYRPGLRLSVELARHADSEVILLESHGVVLHSDRSNILARWQEFEKEFLAEFSFKNILEESTLGFEALIQKYPKGQLKVYFPDTAVFLKELSELLTSAPSTEMPQLAKSATEKTKGLVEILAATYWLQAHAPKLTEVPLDVASGLAQLPTEQYRKALHQ